MLGVYYAENEDDKKAAQCLKKAIELDPYNLKALLALGTSSVNEVNTVGALTALKSWIQHNPAFQELHVEVDAYSDGTMVDDVMQLMLAAAQVDPNNPDVHTLLGLLYNISSNYTAALTHFKKALEFHPDDYALLNKVSTYLLM
jgi:peroxin-5